MSDWVDTHSVTCAICGELADERRTVNLWPDEIAEPKRRKKVQSIVDDVGHGEAHIDCVEEYND